MVKKQGDTWKADDQKSMQAMNTLKLSFILTFKLDRNSPEFDKNMWLENVIYNLSKQNFGTV